MRIFDFTRLTSFAENEISDDQARHEHHKQHEVAVVVRADAVAHKRAVMVKLCHASVRYGAVLRAIRLATLRVHRGRATGAA